MVGGNEDEIFVEDGGGAEALVGDVVADFSLPNNFAIQIQRRGMDRAAIEKVDEKSFPITGHCG